MIEYLILNGALEVVAFDKDSNQFVYSFTPKVKDIMPALYEEHRKNINEEIMSLWEKGHVNIDLFAKDPVVTLTDKAFDNKELAKLSKKDLWSLNEIKRILAR